MRTCLIAVIFALVASSADAGCLTDPQAWTKHGGRPMDLGRYERDMATCRNEASTTWRQKPWITKYVGCMKRHRYIPLYHGVFC
jgi:hypothetical protein